MHLVTFNGTSVKKPIRPDVTFEDAATIDSSAAYTLDPDFDSLGTRDAFHIVPGIVCTDGGTALHREGWLDAAA